jgi:tRNA (guanine6-N2)-methyltransferase
MCAALDLDRVVIDTVHLQSLPGAVERLLQACLDLGTPEAGNVRRAGDAVVLDVHGPLSGDLLLGQVGPLYHSRRFPALRRVPASTNPVIAALLVQLLKARPGDVVYDPFCGAGTLLVEAAALDGDLVLLGSDISWTALTEATANRAAPLLFRADATRLPVPPDSVDRLVSNLPFGKRVGSHSANVKLYPAFIAELSRVLRADGRAVLLTDDKNLLRRSVQSTPGTRILREVQVATGSLELHPTAFVVERTRTARRSAARAGRLRA